MSRRTDLISIDRWCVDIFLFVSPARTQPVCDLNFLSALDVIFLYVDSLTLITISLLAVFLCTPHRVFIAWKTESAIRFVGWSDGPLRVFFSPFFLSNFNKADRDREIQSIRRLFFRKTLVAVNARVRV